MTESKKRSDEIMRMQRFKDLSFESFKTLATDNSLSPNERIGFPDEYRGDREGDILLDILAKLPSLGTPGRTVIDIGPGCAPLAHAFIDLCGRNEHELVLVDSAEMLQQLPDAPRTRKVAAYFPRDCRSLVEDLTAKVDVVLTYSVFHYVFAEYPWHTFLDACLRLLSPGGEMLIGDIPNSSKRKRFFASEAGIQFHKGFTQTNAPPAVSFNTLDPGQIDDATVMDIVLRCRQAGYDAYIVPQNNNLPMANRREDVLIRRP
jgi:SAM-dependent methyltransferase